MPTEICLTIADDGSMTVSAGEKQETPEQEQGEGGKTMPVKSLEEALGTIKQLATAAAMPAEGADSQQAPDQQGPPPAAAPGEEEDAMMAGYRPGQTGR